MTKTWVSYLLIALIACQSVIAMADNHQSHQFGIEHVEFEHEHAFGSIDNKASSKVDVSSSAPSQDECHCHMMCHLPLSINQKETKNTVSKQNPAVYQRAYLSNIQAPNLRPPIV